MVVTLLYAKYRVFISIGKNRATIRGIMFEVTYNSSTPLIPLSTSPSLLLITFSFKLTPFAPLMPQNVQFLHDSKAHPETVTSPASFSTRKRVSMVPTADIYIVNDVILLKFEKASFSITSKVECAMKKLSTFAKSINIAERIRDIDTRTITKETTFSILLKATLSLSDMLTVYNMIDEK